MDSLHGNSNRRIWTEYKCIYKNGKCQYAIQNQDREGIRVNGEREREGNKELHNAILSVETNSWVHFCRRWHYFQLKDSDLDFQLVHGWQELNNPIIKYFKHLDANVGHADFKHLQANVGTACVNHRFPSSQLPPKQHPISFLDNFLRRQPIRPLNMIIKPRRHNQREGKKEKGN